VLLSDLIWKKVDAKTAGSVFVVEAITERQT
jgi:hypothetical protein